MLGPDRKGVLLSVAVTLCLLHSLSTTQNASQEECQEEPLINVTVVLINDLENPTFNLSVAMTHAPGSTALRLLEEVVNRHFLFGFTIGYSQELPNCGLLSVAGVGHGTVTAWTLVTATGLLFVYGLDRYLPQNGEVLVFVYKRFQGRPCTSMFSVKGPGQRCGVREFVTVSLVFMGEPGRGTQVVRLALVPRASLLQLLGLATLLHPQFPGFQATYRGPRQGYHLRGAGWEDEKATWSLTDRAGGSLPQSRVHVFKPNSSEVITFLYVPGSESNSSTSAQP